MILVPFLHFHLVSGLLATIFGIYCWLAVIGGVLVFAFAVIGMPPEADMYTASIYHSGELWLLLALYLAALGLVGIWPFSYHREYYLNRIDVKTDLERGEQRINFQ